MESSISIIQNIQANSSSATPDAVLTLLAREQELRCGEQENRKVELSLMQQMMDMNKRLLDKSNM